MSNEIRRRPAWAVRWSAWLLVTIACGWLVARATIVTDITAFLPGPATREQALLAQQLRDGVSARVILLGIEAGDANAALTAAQRSQQLAAALRADPRFAFVANGDPAAFAADRDRLFEARYLLSAQVTPQRFSVDGLRDAAAELEALLRSSAAPLVKPFAARDPTGELLAILSALKPARAPIAQHGVWFDATGRTALLLATTKAPGFDVDAQAEATAAVRAAFSAANVKSSKPDGLQLHLTGPGVFAVASRAAIQQDAQRLTLIAGVAVALLLLLVLRSPRFLLWAALPTATGALIGLAAVAAVFGSIHGITLGFGLTLIGEAVDYAVYVQVQRQSENVRPDANKPLWRALWLAVLTSSAGFIAMMVSGFQGLMQLGLMSIAGIAVAALVARFLLPDVLRPLEPARLAPFAPLARLAAYAPRLRVPIWLAAAAAMVLLVARGPALWNDELAAISPLARGSGEMDARLRGNLGLGDLRFVVAVEGATLDEALTSAEALEPRLKSLQGSAAIVGFDSPANLVPSEATQAARRAALPDEAELRARLKPAWADSALRPEAFEPFVGDVQRARSQRLAASHYAGTALGQRLAAQLVQNDGRAAALITLTGVNDGAAVAAALRSAAGVTLIDLTDVQTLVADYRVHAAWAALGGGLLIVLILAVQLRDARTTARIATAVAVSIAITAAALVLIEGRLTLFHLVALLLAAGISTNYALFFGLQASPSAPVTLSVILASATTLIAFTALAASSTPVLHMIGVTVAIGACVALVVSMALAAPVPHAEVRPA